MTRQHILPNARLGGRLLTRVAPIALAMSSVGCARIATRDVPLPYVELEIRQTPSQSDDYVGSVAAPARVRISNSSSWNPIPDTPVRLSNVADFTGGKVLFGPSTSPAPSANALSLTLPGNGAWVDFAVVGAPGQTSARDKDAVIEVREDRTVTTGGTAHEDGTVLARRALMVLPAGTAVPTSGAAVEIRIRRTAITLDDYLTWSPVLVDVKLAQPNPAGQPVTVTLRNMSASGGQLAFGPAPASPLTVPVPTQPTVQVTLAADGTTWTQAVAAGAFGHASARDKDAVLEVASGAQVLGREGTMVRIRKNAESLTNEERDRFLRTLLRHHQLSTTNYATAQSIHTLVGHHVQGHGGPAFLPWHRAFVLRLERELQAVDPGVALPYWRSGVPAPHVFSVDFMGLSSPNPNWGANGWAQFSSTNPLQFWAVAVSGTGYTGIRRRPSFLPTEPAGALNGAVRVLTDGETIALTGDYDGWEPLMENDPHGMAHVYAGGSDIGWLRDVSISVADPLFFLHHANVDRQWALWQTANPARFDSTNAGAYKPVGERTGSDCSDIGSHLWDKMWPWNGLITTCWPAAAPGGTFPPTVDALLTLPAAPRPGDVLDYRRSGLNPSGLGFAYDDIPHGP
jgi:tyrosinase